MNKKQICQTWRCNLAEVFLSFMGESLLRYSNDYNGLEDIYEFEKRHFLIAYFIASQRHIFISQAKQTQFETQFELEYQNAPYAEVVFYEDNFFDFKMPKAIYKGEWKIMTTKDPKTNLASYEIQATLSMRTEKINYLNPPEGWILENNSDSLTIAQPLMGALSLSLPLCISLALPIHIQLKIVKLENNCLILDYQSNNETMNVLLKATK
jgi:hypothetical protein